MKIKNSAFTLLAAAGLSALMLALNQHRKALLLFNPKAVIGAYFCFGLLCGLVFHRKDFRNISGASLIAALIAGLILTFLISLTGPRFIAFHLFLISGAILCRLRTSAGNYHTYPCLIFCQSQL